MKISIFSFIFKVLQENGSNGFLVGSQLSLADIGLLEPLLTIEELMGVQELEAFPEVLVCNHLLFSCKRI
jgi:hypothetical protein